MIFYLSYDGCLPFYCEIYPFWSPLISSQAPVHVLVIPKKPIGGVSDVQPADEAILGHLFVVASEVR